jgi:prolyl oligopeptidase
VPLPYPATRRDETVVDDYHGTPVADPYRWLEDPNSAETAAWVEAQNHLTDAWLADVPARERIRARLTELWDYEKVSVPFRVDQRWFRYRNDGLQNQSVLCVGTAPEGPWDVLLDPNQLSADGTVALGPIAVSEDGRWLAYALSSAGSDWQEWRVRDIAAGEDLGDRLRWSKFSGAAWTHDGLGFFYSAYDEPAEGTAYHGANYFQKLYYHRLGTPQSDDELVYERPDQREWGFGAQVTEDGRYLVVTVWRGTERENALLWRDLAVGGPLVELPGAWEASWQFVGNDGPCFWLLTDRDAPRQRLLAIDLGRPDEAHWATLIPESEDALQGVSAVGGQFLATYLHHAHGRVLRFGLDGTPGGEVTLPGLGSVGGFGGRRDDTQTFYSFTSFTTPGEVYRYDLASGESTLLWRPRVACAPDAFETRQVFVTSRDGTRLPMFITHRRGLALDGSHPTWLYGYGGFNIALTPGFSPAMMVWMELGGVYAVPNLRGGGEYGKAWHDAGRRLHKQNVFDDFIAAGEWLCANGYTSPERLAIAGGSNGGLLVGACLTQRPDLCAVALPAVGVLDMLRFHRFTIGWGWVSDYGSANDPDEFRALLAYSPLHNLHPGTAYPATLITTSDHDDRVVPAHSYKFAAALQAAQAGDAPVLLRVEVQAGHGAGKPTSKVLVEAADRLAFCARETGMG